MNVLVLTGSLRAASTNRKLATAAIDLLPQGVTVTEFDRLGELPNFSEDFEDDVPAVAADYRRTVDAADALLIVTPEYNGLPSGVIKNAIDWASRPRESAAIAGKPVAVIGASGSPGGAKRAREAAVLSLKVAGARPLETTVGVPSSYQAFTTTGLADPQLEAELAALLRELAATLVTT